jgi:ribonuclease HI
MRSNLLNFVKTLPNLAKNKKQKFYVVWIGFQPGVYVTWEECEANVIGFPGAKFKSYTTIQEANEAFREGVDYQSKTSSHIEKEIRINSNIRFIPEIITQSIVVDGAYSSKSKEMEYQGVLLENKARVFHAGPFMGGSNNISEFLGIVHALAYCKKNGLNCPIYSDSFTAITWVKKGKCKTTLEPEKSNVKIHELIHRAESWLLLNNYVNPILKWETESWGENPADFGRK